MAAQAIAEPGKSPKKLPAEPVFQNPSGGVYWHSLASLNLGTFFGGPIEPVAEACLSRKSAHALVTTEPQDCEVRDESPATSGDLIRIIFGNRLDCEDAGGSWMSQGGTDLSELQAQAGGRRRQRGFFQFGEWG